MERLLDFSATVRSKLETKNFMTLLRTKYMHQYRIKSDRSSLAQVTGYAVGYKERYQPSPAKRVTVIQYASVSCIRYAIRWLHGTLVHRL